VASSQWVSQLGLLLFLASGAAVGGRLLWRGVATRAVPELLLGVTYGVGGVLGYVPLVLVVSGAVPDRGIFAFRAFGHLGLEASALALYAFVWRVFRPGTAALVVGAGVLLAASYAGLHLFDGLVDRRLGGSPAYWLDFSARGAAYAWAAVEAGLYWVRMRRRRGLGLADPVLTHRFLLWTVSMAAICGMFANNLVMNALAGGAPPPLWYLVDGLLAALASATMWVTFFPPRAYLARLSRASR
jgi:hypothetical protein